MGQFVCPLVSAADRTRLEAILADRNRAQKHVARARIILHSAERLPVSEVAKRAGVGRPAVWRWQRRFAEAGVDGLLREASRKPGKAPVPAEVVQQLIALTCAEPPGEATHWTGRAMAKAMGVSLRTVQRIWAAHKLQPHRLRTFKRSTDPDFAAKLEGVVGLYVDPPKHALVLSIDEKSQIQALDRTQPGLPLKPGKAGTITHDYVRNGTTTLFAALNTLEGTVIGRCMARHRHQEFLRFLGAIERDVPAGKVIHAIVDNYGTHSHSKVRAWLCASPPLDLSLHAQVRLLAERGRDLLLGAYPPPHPTRQLSLDRRPAGCHQPLHRRAQRQPQAVHLDQARRPDPRQTESSQCVGALGALRTTAHRLAPRRRRPARSIVASSRGRPMRRSFPHA
jgi:Homeodomain-like domain